MFGVTNGSLLDPTMGVGQKGAKRTSKKIRILIL